MIGSNELLVERAKSLEKKSLSTEAVNIKRNLSFDSKQARRLFTLGKIDDSVSADKGLVKSDLNHTCLIHF